MPAADEESPADTEASQAPNVTRTAKTTPDAAPTPTASHFSRARFLAAYRPPSTTESAGIRRNR
jgi:hypothetical protein